MIRQSLLTLFFFCFALLQYAEAQKNPTISGTLRDGETGETLIGATVFLPNQETGTATNEYGFYSITIPPDSVTIVFSYIGFQSQVVRIQLTKDTTINLELGNAEILDEVVVSAESNRERLNSTQTGLETLTMKEAKAIPAFLGEVDIIKTLQLKPGVSSGSEGQSGLFVRGGGPDQNLIILDEAVVYNPSHLFGFFSTFNSDAVKNVELYKSGFPAEYGGKLSSVIDVKLNEGNRKKFSGTGGLGLISSRLTLEGPIIKDKASFVISGRRTYADIFTREINKANADNPDAILIPDYYFYDLNAKLNFELGPKDNLFLSGYFGRDVFTFKQDNFAFNFDWGNTTGTARWNHVFNPKLFSNTTVTFSDYVYSIKNQFDVFEFKLSSGIQDVNMKTDFSWFPNKKHTAKFGLNATYHTFDVGRFNAGNAEGDLFNTGQQFYAWEFGAYASDDYEVSSLLKLNIGLRISGFYNEKFYYGIEPRVAAKYSLSDDVSIKASYARMNQYIHLVATSGANLPTDVWYPSNAKIKPQISDQVSLGISWAIGDQFLLSNEVFYKNLNQQVDFRDGAQLFVNPNLDDEFVFGTGYSYGNEIYLEKKSGKFTGWIGYTLAWSKRKFPDINDGKEFFPGYDRRHDISVVAIYEISKRVTASLAWIYGTGNAYSLPSQRFNFFNTEGNFFDFNIVPVYKERNTLRQAAYHRMDVGVVWKLFPKSKWLDGDLTFSAFNVYDRRNAFFVFIDILDENDDGFPERFQPTQVSLFPIIPSVTFNFKF